MTYKNFIYNLNNDNTLELLKLWNLSEYTFRNDDIIYLKRCYMKSERIKLFYNEYYKTLPLDVKEDRYFKSMIEHYKYMCKNNIFEKY